MSRCNHANAKFAIVIERWCDAYLQTSEICDSVQVTRDVPFSIKIQVNCPDCDFRSRYNAYNTTIAAEPGRFGGRAADRWPTWLLTRLIPLRTQNAAVQEACLACGVGPMRHACWEEHS